MVVSSQPQHRGSEFTTSVAEFLDKCKKERERLELKISKVNFSPLFNWYDTN